MKILILITALCISSNLFAYNIGGAYASLLSCNWGQYGYEHGYIGTYRTINGQIYTVFFGSNYCQH